MMKVFFFFQEEEGIRDDLVTGVQTCALPVCAFLGVTLANPPGEPVKAGSEQTASKTKKKAPAETVAPQDAEYHKVDPSQYVGSETCKTCHGEMAAGFDKGPHRKTTLAKHQGPQWQRCEACPGP